MFSFADNTKTIHSYYKNYTKITLNKLHTSLGFKFFILFLAISSFVRLAYGQGISSPDSRQHAGQDTLFLPAEQESRAFPADTLVSPDEFQPAVVLPDTLPGDTIAEPERYTGTGVILDAKVEYSAQDSIFFDMRNRKVFLYGEADLKYEDIHLEADFVEIDFRKNELFAKGLPDSLGVVRGNPVFTEGPQSFKSEELRYNFDTQRGRTTNVMTEEADGYVHGEVVKMQDNKIVHVAEGKYTTCDNPEPHFHIGFRKAKIIPDDKIVTSFAFLVIRDVPTPLFVPFGFFPNTRGQASGILVPSYGESSNRGFYLENGGFYWGINDYIDLSLRGDIYSRGSWAARLGSDYRVRYRYSGSLNLTYAVNVFGEPNLPDYQRNRDFRVVWNHNQDPKARPNSTFRANVNAGSSESTRFNPVSDEEYLSNTFSSNVSYSANWANRYNFSANLRHSQNTINQSVDLTLPEVAFSVARFHPFRRGQATGSSRWYEDINMSYTMNARNELRTVDTLLFTPDVWSEFRHGINHRIPISHSMQLLNHFNVSTSFNYNESWYFNTIRREWEWDNPDLNAIGPDASGRVVTDTVPGFRAARDFNFSTGISTRLYGMMQFRRGPLTAMRHVMTPSVNFSYRPDFADPFWNYYQTYYDYHQDREVQYSVFEGSIYRGPQANRSGMLNFSLTNNLEIKLRNRKDPDAEPRKIALIDNFTVSGGYDFIPDSLNWSDIRLSGTTRVFGNFDIRYSSSWTPYARDASGNYIDQLLWDSDGRLMQLNNTSWNLSFNYSLSSDGGGRGSGGGLQRPGMNGQNGMSPHENGLDGFDQEGNGLPPETEEVPMAAPLEGIDYSVPWSLRFSYTFNYNSRYRHVEEEFDRSYVQNLSFSGDVSLTPNWRIGFRSGYDFERNEITYTSVNLYRDLHCWEMTLNWIPFGFRKSYNLTIRVKSSVLQDLKLTRRTHHLDRPFN